MGGEIFVEGSWDSFCDGYDGIGDLNNEVKGPQVLCVSAHSC